MNRTAIDRLRASVVATSLALFGMHAVAQDFNGDGFADLAIGSPGESVGTVAGAGAVTIIYGAGPGAGLDSFAPLPATVYTQATFGFDAPETDDGFGHSLAWGDFNGDGFDDLAVGTPREDSASGLADVGLVLVYYGTPGGLAPLFPPVIAQGAGGLPDPAESDDLLGWALASGDFNADGIDDLALSVPGEDFTFADQGFVHQVFGSPGGLMPVGAPIPTFVQSMLGDPDEATDEFGLALAAGDLDGLPGDDLAIGVPSEDFSGKGDCGMVNVVYATAGFGLDPTAVTPPQSWTQASPGVPSSIQHTEHFGWALAIGNFDGASGADLAIGVPHENIGANSDCGLVNVLYSSGPGIGLDAFAAVGAERWHQNIAGIPEKNDAFDWFGYSLVAGDFNGDRFDDLAIGVPFEDVGSTTDAGFVNVIYGAGPGFGLDAFGPVTAQRWHQNRPGVPNFNEASDRFGWSLSVGDFDGNGCADLVVGVPWEDIGSKADCGVINTIYGNTAPGVGLDGAGAVGSEQWHQNSPGVPNFNESGDTFGRGLDSDK